MYRTWYEYDLPYCGNANERGVGTLVPYACSQFGVSNIRLSGLQSQYGFIDRIVIMDTVIGGKNRWALGLPVPGYGAPRSRLWHLACRISRACEYIIINILNIAQIAVDSRSPNAQHYKTPLVYQWFTRAAPDLCWPLAASHAVRGSHGHWRSTDLGRSRGRTGAGRRPRMRWRPLCSTRSIGWTGSGRRRRH